MIRCGFASKCRKRSRGSIKKKDGKIGRRERERERGGGGGGGQPERHDDRGRQTIQNATQRQGKGSWGYSQPSTKSNKGDRERTID